MMIDHDMMDAAEEAIKRNDTKFWRKRAKEIEAQANMSTKQSRMMESLKRNGSGQISMSNFYWGEDTGEGDELAVQTKPANATVGSMPVKGPETTSDVSKPDGWNDDDGDSQESSDISVDFDPDRGIKIEIDGHVGYIPHGQIEEFIDFAKNALSNAGSCDEDDDGSYGSDEDDDEEDREKDEEDEGNDGNFIDMASFLKNM